MRHELIIQLILTTLSVGLLLLVLLYGRPKYVEKWPEGITGPVANVSQGAPKNVAKKKRVSQSLGLTEAETTYKPSSQAASRPSRGVSRKSSQARKPSPSNSPKTAPRSTPRRRPRASKAPPPSPQNTSSSGASANP